MEPQPIRVWLEPGYDRGRFGAWMLDLPGCFVWGPNRDVALARVPSGVGSFAWWLSTHGEVVAVPETDQLAVVEEVPVEPAPGWERNATFEPDRRPLDPAAFEAALRHLEFARHDLVATATRVDAFEEAHGPMPADPDQAASAALGEPVSERSSDEVLRHVGRTSIWLAGRLDALARYAGPPDEGDRDAFSAATHEWTIAELRRHQGDDPAVTTSDRRGETWTLPKVVRRLLYHSLDHLGELDRRLARADGAAERLTIRRDVLIDPPALEALFRSVGWYRLVREPGRLARLIEGSTQIVSAWDGERLVGFGRAISDDAAYGLISTVAVHPGWQGRGVARRMVLALLENNDAIRFSLSAVPGAEGLYESLGFVLDPRAMVRRRRY